MANFFDQFDKPAKGNFFDQFDGPEKKEGAFERAARIARDEDGGVLPAVGSLIASALPEGGDKRTAGGFFKDTAVDLTRGVVGLGQSAVGLGNLARGVIGTVAFGGLVSPGALGKDLEDLGYSGEQTQKFLSGLYTQDRQEADRNVEEAKGFFNTLGALAVNPSSLVGQVVQSVPQTVAAGAAGGAIVRALLPGATQAAAAAGLVGDDAANFISNYVSKRALAAAAGSEGALTAGSIAESGREAGQEFSTYAPAAVVGGVGTGLIGAASGAIGRRLGIGDIEADIAMRGAGVVPTAGAGSRLKQIGKDALKEGVLEEAPQSFQEQLATQYAQGRPFDLEEAASAAAQGLASGAVMGGAGALVRPRAPAQVPAAPADQDAALTGQAGRLTAATDAYLRGGLQSSDPTDVLSSVVSAPTPNGDIGAAITAADQAAGPSIEEMMRQKRQAAADRVAQELGYPTIDVNAPADGGLIADIQARSQAAVSAAQAELGLPPATAPVVQQDFAARRESAARAAQGELGIELPTAPPVVGDQLTPTQKQELVRQQMQAPARAPDLVTQVQQQVQTQPATTGEDVARVRTEVEEQALQRWQAEYDQQTAAQAEKQGVEAAKAATETQARMRESQDETALAELDRIAQGERQRAVDSLVRAYGERTQFSSAATVLQTNQQLTRLGQQPLTKSERDRVVTLLDSARTFTSPAQEQVQVIPDRGADNAALEQQIPEKKDNLPRPANIGGQPASSYSVSQLTDLIANTSIPAITRRGAQVELLARQQEQAAPAPAAPALPAAVTPAGPTIVPSAKRTPEQGLQVAAAKRSEKTGQQVTFTVADVATLPTMAKAGGGLSKQAHTIINNVSRVFGKKLVVFDSDDAGAADGFVIDDDPDTIYLNRKSEVPHLVVFGHELLHSLRRDNKDAYESIVKSIKMAEGVDISETPGIRGDIEEFTADLLGNRFRETEFWVGTFRDIIASKGQAEGKKVVTRLAATATRAINGLMKALGRAPGFNTDKMVANLGDVKTALRGALSNYANQRYDAAVALERERLSGPARGETVPVAESGGEVVTSARRGEKPGQLDGLVGYHFSNQARQTLSTGFYGTGLRGSDRDEIQSYPDKRVGKRLSFYFDKGTGVRPESGVGGVAHRVALDNIYDSDSDPLKLKRGANKRAFEAAVLDAGFDGYMTRLEGTQPGQVVVLGDRTYKPEVLGPRSRINDSEPAVAQAAQEPQWKNVATGPTREGLQDRMARMESSGSWSGYDMQIVEAGRGFYALQTRPKVVPSEKRGESGRPEQAGDRAGRYSIGSLAPLEGAPNVAGASGPDPRLVAVAEEYARETGIPLRRQGSYVQVDEDRARRIAAAYDAMPHAPLDPAVREAYDNLARQTLAQYRALERAGYQFYLVDETNDPYGGNPWNAMRDLRANQRMGVFATEAGFGTSDFDPEGNPLLADTGLEWSYGSPDGPKKRVLFNDLFRAVHDAFGHGLEGAGFRAQGEENAWQAHVRLFTGSAVGAITSETRGQNSWLNYGPYGEQNRNARVEDTVFADQKTGLMPEWTWTEGRAEDEIRESAKRGPQKIEVGKTILQSEPLTPEQWASVREIGLKRMTPEERAEVEAAERRVSVNTETADKKSVEYVSIAKAALDSMPVPQLSTVPILSGRAPLRVIPTGKVGKDGKRKTRVFDVARALRNRFLKRAGDINTEQGQEAIARAMAHEALYALSQDGHAVGWYDRKVVEAIANAAIAHPRILTDRESNFMFRVVLAVTSNGQAVRDNFSFGNSILKTWFETNRLPEQFDGGGARSPAMKLAFAKVNRLVQEHGWEKTEQILRQLRQVGQIEKEFDLKISGENKKTLVPVAVGMGGPKIGNFFANLSGFFDNPTMDLWFMRTVGRMAGSNLATKPSLVKFLDDLSKLLPETGEVNGIDVKDIREEIAAYKALEPDEQTDPELTIQYLQKTEQYARKQYQIFSTGTGKVYENGKTRTFDDKSPLNLNARSLVNNLSTLVEAPGSGNERNNLRKIVNRALALLRQRGIQLNAADLQAVLWYYEKNLYGKVGNISESAKPWDYASAARWGVGRELGLVDVKPSGRARPVREGESGQPDLERPGSVREGGAVNAPQSEQPLSPGPFTRARSLTQRQAGDAGPADVVASEPPAEPRVVLSEKRTPLGFYSALAAGVGQIKTNAAPAQGWKDAIKGLVNKGQVKQDEVEWSGVNDWLDLQQGKVTREEVAEYLKQGGVQVEETVLGGAGGWSVVDQATGGDQFVEAFATEQEAEARAQELGAREYAAIPSGNTPTAETKYAKYTLPGGTNYREVLLTLPFRGPNFGDWAAARGIQLQALSASEADRLGDEFDAQAERGMYRSKHWDPPNVLAHIRVNDRTDADGKRVLFVEELQSDWGQEGKKKGFIGGKVKGYQVQFNGRPVMTYETRQEADAHVERAKGFDKEAPVSVVEVETTRHSVNERAEGKVLNAPFVTKTEGWLNLALKRVMIMAAEGGYDRVAFTTGAQNAERFSLDKTLREIAYEPTEDGKYEITATDLEGTEVISEDEVRLDRIEELVGKEIAEKIARDEGERDDDGYREWRYLRGDNLKVEAKGMRAFYDTIVPTALKKLLPKVGGGQMAAVNIIDAAREPEMVGVDEDGDAIYDDGIGDSLQQPGFDVTPAMREKVSEGLPLFSEKRNIPDLNAAQEQALRNVGGVVVEQTVGERAAEFKNAFARNWIGGIFDQFNELRSLGPKAYMLARMSKGSEGTLEATMLYGKPFLTADGVADVKLGGEGFAKVLGKLEGEHDRFLWWVAAQRADQLKAQGLENLFTDKDISALKSLNQGNTARGTARGRLYAEALRDMNDFNDAILKIAEQSGLVDPEARALFKNNPYVPFYRVMEGDGVSGPTFSSGLTNQYAWKKLKGGSQKLNNDLLANVLMNWSHLLSASAKNRALTESLKAGVAAGVAQKVPSGTKESVRVRVNGKEEHYLVSDPGVMSAISAIEYRTPGFFRPFSTMKRWLSVGVTANPAYKVKNLIRDSVAAPAVSDLSGNVIGNVAQGIRQGAEDSQTFASMLAGGGVIRFGSMLDGGNADRTRTLVRKEGGVLLDEAGWKKVSNWMGDLWDAYNTVGDKFENANRVALYEQLKAKGYSDLEANFLARDLMDFSMSGRWPLIRFLVETVPFLNARLQGLFKLGRGAKENPRKFGAVVGAVALASIALLAAYEDDEDWKRREDWDRDTNWWFKIGDMSFRIPKPFEVGAIGTIAERGWEMAFNKEMDMKRFGQSLSRMIFSTFAMDPTPQIVKPILDVYMNKGAFTNRPIESMTMARQRPEDRYDENTSYAARFLGQMGIPSPLGLARAEYTKLSPVQIDYLIRGYFAWLGTAATTVLDFGIRPMMDAGDRPDRTLKDTFFVGNFVETLPAGGSRYVTQLYEQSREIEQAYASYRDALKENDRARARELSEDYAEEFRARPRVNKATKEIAEIRRQINMIESSKSITGETKRVRIDNLRQKMARIAERATAP